MPRFTGSKVRTLQELGTQLNQNIPIDPCLLYVCSVQPGSRTVKQRGAATNIEWCFWCGRDKQPIDNQPYPSVTPPTCHKLTVTLTMVHQSVTLSAETQSETQHTSRPPALSSVRGRLCSTNIIRVTDWLRYNPEQEVNFCLDSSD